MAMNLYVPAIGPKDAKIMIVGEGPGKKELEAGVPFIGPSGKLLDQFLTGAGLDRSEIYLTNVTKTYPKFERDKSEFFFDSGMPTKAFMEGILELLEEIKEVNPNVIVPLGNYALWAVAQKDSISKWRGSIVESALVKEKKVIPTIHPAWYIHTFQDNKKLLGNWDFQRIAEQSKFPEIRRREQNFIISPTSEQVEALLERFTDPSLDHLTCDTEWYSPDSFAYIGFADSPTEAACIKPDTMLAWRAIKEICESPIPKVWQNCMFDAVALHRLGISVRNVAHDTMLMWHNCWGMTLEEKSLQVIGSVLTEEPYYKDEGGNVGKQDDAGQVYCCKDCVVTEEAFLKMRDEEMPLTGVEKGYNISMNAMNTFIHASQRGLRVNRDRLLELKQAYTTSANEREDRFSQRIGFTVNCRSWQQVQRAIYDELGLGKRFTKRSTDQAVLMDIAATLHAEGGHEETVEILKDIILVRRDRNIVSRYINENIIDSDGRCRTNWNLAGTKNGRFSATKPWWPGLPLQTVPEEAREIFEPDEGNCFVGWDLEQAEARVVAVKAHDFDLLDDMANGVDIHVKLGSMLPFGMSYEQLMEKVKRVGKDNCEERVLSKTTRHASNYIQSYIGLKRTINKHFIDTGIGVNDALAKKLSSGFLEACPGLEPWWRSVLATVNEEGYLTNAFGRRRNWYQRVRWQDHEHKDAVAFYPQSTVGDLTTLCITEMDQYDWVFPHLHMHDGGILEVPEDRKEETIELVRKHMTKEILVDGIPLTIPVELKVGYDWRNMKKVK